MNKEALNVLINRRSIRKFQKKQVEEEQLQEILKAGTYAATGMGRQSPIMIVVQEPEMIEKLRRMNARFLGNENADPFYGAPTIIIVLADRSVPTCVEDGSLVLGNLMNAAYAVGVDSCWIHRAKQEFETDEGKAILRGLGIEGDYIGVGHLSLGYRDCEYPTPRDRKENYIYRI